jgi:hypothetical protein
MISRLHSLGNLRRLALAGLVVLLLPAASEAETIQIKNEAGGPIIVVASCVVRGQKVSVGPYKLDANDSSPGICLPGNKVIQVYDAKAPNRLIFQGAVPGGPNDLQWAIMPDPQRPGFKLDPRKPPAPMPP